MMNLTPEQIEQAAVDLIEAEEKGRQIGLLSLRHPDITLEDAYSIQLAQTARKLNQGRRIIGWKVGLTSRVMQEALGIDTPDSGVLFDDMAFESGAVVPLGRFIQPRIETEIAFIMRDTVTPDATREDVLEATEFIAPAIEILDTRIQRMDPETRCTRRIFDTVADNAANAGIVLGHARHRPKDVAMRWIGAIVHRNDEVEATGLGAAVLGDPVLAVVWLARRMRQYGQKIQAGQVILSGSFVSPVECPPGSRIDADFGDFGSVEISFE